jgi:hypothetical protein
MPDGSYATVALVAAEGHPEGVTVYNFGVQGDHSYFVSGAGQADAVVWVHNYCGPGRAGKQAKLRDLAHDPNVSAADRGWIKREMNSIARGET